MKGGTSPTAGGQMRNAPLRALRWRLGTLALRALVLVLVLGAGACRGEDRVARATAPLAPPSWDDREAAALQGSGKEISDARHDDTGLNISDAQASLLDEELCDEACGHLFDLLAAEQRVNLASDPGALEVFLQELEKNRERRSKTCVADCRRYADLEMVRCVQTATDRKSLDLCDF